MKKQEQKYKNAITKLTAYDGNRYQKYNRNYKLYCYSPNVSLDTFDQTVGYYQQGFFDASDDTTSSIQENVIYSCISSLVSKIASQKARPFINTVNGTFSDIQTAKAAQQYFDILYDEQNIYKTISNVFRDCCIFDTGWVFIDRDSKSVIRANPWQVYTSKLESSNGCRKQIAYKIEHYPTILLEGIDTTKEECTYIRYWNIKDHKFVTFIPELQHYVEEDWEPDTLPFIDIHYETPINGTSSQSVVDMLYGIQMEIDTILEKIKEASQLNPANTIFIPEQSTIKATKLNNQVGQVVTYTATPNMTGSPVTVATPAFIDGQYITLLESLKNDAYELVGISQLSATSQKPIGLDSGAALQTMENIESDRFQTQLNQVLRLYVDIAKAIISIYPKNEEILPDTKSRLNVKWSDILKVKEKMSIQFSAADSLSKDPATKLKQLQMLSQAGILPANRIASLMQMPDLELGYSFADNNLNAINTVIKDCIENDIYEVPPYISIESLKPEILNVCLQLKASGKDNEKDIEKLMKLYSGLLDTETSVGEAQQSDEASQLLDDEANDLNYKTQQLDMQNEQLTSIQNDLANGVLTPEEAQSQIDAMGSLNLEI